MSCGPAVIPASAIQISGAEGVQGMQTLSMSSAGTGSGNTIVQYTQGDGQFFVPGTWSGWGRGGRRPVGSTRAAGLTG